MTPGEIIFLCLVFLFVSSGIFISFYKDSKNAGRRKYSRWSTDYRCKACGGLHWEENHDPSFCNKCGEDNPGFSRSIWRYVFYTSTSFPWNETTTTERKEKDL